MRTRSGRPGPSRCSWPTTSSSVRGRSRAASGARRSSRSSTAAANRSSATRPMLRPTPRRASPLDLTLGAVVEAACQPRAPSGVFSTWASHWSARRTAVARVRRVSAVGAEPVDDRSADTADSASAPITIDLGFEEPFDELYARAYGVGYQLLGRRSEAEDVAQETLARAFVHWRKVRGYAEAWVVRVAGNLAIDTWRAAAGRHRRRRRTPDATTPGPNALRVDLHRALDDAVAAPARGDRPALPGRPARGRRRPGARAARSAR